MPKNEDCPLSGVSVHEREAELQACFLQNDTTQLEQDEETQLLAISNAFLISKVERARSVSGWKHKTSSASRPVYRGSVIHAVYIAILNNVDRELSIV